MGHAGWVGRHADTNGIPGLFVTQYKDMIRVTGPAFLVLSFLARLPAAMVPLGVITLVAAVTGSFATAGATAAAYGIGAALGGPAVGTFADRFGQRSAGLVAAILNALALAAIVVAVGVSAPSAFVMLAAAVAGLCTPQVGPLARVRWSALLSAAANPVPASAAQPVAASVRRSRLATAFSYEGAADELSYMAGPALVGVIAVLGFSWLPLVIAAVLTLLAAVPFALHRTAVAGSRAVSSREPLPMVPLSLLIVAMSGIGIVFGATQTGVTAFAEELGMPSAAGLIYAALGVGSAVAGLATAWLPARWTSLTRYGFSALALATGALALVLAPSTLAGVTAAMLAVGVVSAPYLIAVFALGSEVTPPSRAGTAMTLLGSGVVAGVALGAALAGRLADTYGHMGAFTVPLAAAILALATAFTFRVVTRPAHPTPAPA